MLNAIDRGDWHADAATREKLERLDRPAVLQRGSKVSQTSNAQSLRNGSPGRGPGRGMTAMGRLAAGNRISGYELTTANSMRTLPATDSHRTAAWHLVGILLLAIAGCALRPRW
ncbi:MULTISPECIES: hypothetical protein [Sphingomonas]|uniref:hypothetical protein n=1 Tax=Sphingomonas TaxID=13687 RepID=UPI000F7ECD4D|nr:MULTISPECIES: hypothetical protein [Sphingomonas]